MEAEGPEDFGEEIRREREQREVTLEQLANVTRVSVRQLEALEAGRFSQLPAKVFARGFVRAVALHLGLDVEKTAAAFSHVYDNWQKAELAARGAAHSRMRVFSPSSAPRRSLSYRTTIAGWGLALVLGLITLGYAIWKSKNMKAPDISGPADGRVAVPASGPQSLNLPPAIAADSTALAPEPAPPVAPATPLDQKVPVLPVASPGPAAVGEAQLTLTLTFSKDCWTEVMVDGKVEVAELCRGGTVREFRGGQKFTLTLGNAGGVAVAVDGKVLSALGTEGQVVRNVVIDRGTILALRANG